MPDYLTETELEALANEEICGAIDEQSLELPLENLAIDTLFQPPCLVSPSAQAYGLHDTRITSVSLITHTHTPICTQVPAIIDV